MVGVTRVWRLPGGSYTKHMFDGISQANRSDNEQLRDETLM